MYILPVEIGVFLIHRVSICATCQKFPELIQLIGANLVITEVLYKTLIRDVWSQRICILNTDIVTRLCEFF